MLNGPVNSAQACGPIVATVDDRRAAGPPHPKAGTGERGDQDQVGVVEGSGHLLVEREPHPGASGPPRRGSGRRRRRPVSMSGPAPSVTKRLPMISPMWSAISGSPSAKSSAAAPGMMSGSRRRQRRPPCRPIGGDQRVGRGAAARPARRGRLGESPLSSTTATRRPLDVELVDGPLERAAAGAGSELGSRSSVPAAHVEEAGRVAHGPGQRAVVDHVGVAEEGRGRGGCGRACPSRRRRPTSRPAGGSSRPCPSRWRGGRARRPAPRRSRRSTRPACARGPTGCGSGRGAPSACTGGGRSPGRR